MLKHNDILDRLDPLRKVALVASALDDETLEQAGVPAVGRVFLGELAAEKGVSYAAAARSFDPALVERMTRELVGEACAAGARLFITPDLKTAADPYGGGLAEDAFLSGEYGAAMARAVHGAGAAAGLSRLSLGERDIAYLDRREDAAAVHDLFVKPFLAASRAAPCKAVFLTPNRAGNGYADTNRALFSDVLSGYFGDVFAVGDGVAPTSSALALLRGKVSLGGAKLPLERAVRRYVQLKKYCEEGSVPARDLDDALRDGSALGGEKLDEAADAVIDFALSLAESAPEEIPQSFEARRELAACSVVLLKNEKILPLARGTRVAFVGEGYTDLAPFAERFAVAGRAQGYERESDRSDALIPDAVRAAGEADVVVLFLVPGDTERTLSMPANRLALLDALKKTGKRIVAVVCGDAPVDLSFDRAADACIVAPPDGPFAAEALARVLAGETDPAGRLARTAFDHADDYFRMLRTLRDAGSIRMGGFVGYLRYDTAGERVRYPFGYGLSYTSFAYSAFAAAGDDISFTVKNTGDRNGCEIAQIYIGAPSASRVAPAKQLKAVCKLALKAGESRRVTVRLPASAYASFDPRTLTDNVEGGVYRIYVCSNALDVKLQGKRTLAGTAREPADETPADFFPNSRYETAANVRRASRMGNAEAVPVPKPLRNARKAALFCLPVAAVILFLLATVLIFANALDYALFSVFDAEAVQWGIYGVAVFFLAALPLLFAFNRKRLARVRATALAVCPVLLVACLVLGIVLSTGTDTLAERIAMAAVSCLAVGAPLMAAVAAIAERALAKSKSGTNRWDKYYFAQEEKRTVTSDAEFEEAFRAAEALAENRKKKEEEAAPPPAEPEQFFDKDLSYAELLRDCSLYVKERGVVADEGTMKNLLAALSSSQFAVIPEGMGADLVSAVAAYFGKQAYVDNAEQYVRGEDLFTQWKQAEGVYRRTAFSTALEAAAREGAFLHVALIRHADVARMEQVFGDLADVAARKKAALTLPDGTERALPPNLCIVAETAEDALQKLPARIAEAAAVLLPKLGEGPVAEKKTAVQSVGYGRFAAMKRAVRDEFPPDDALWRNVDALDEKCRPAHIGNPIWNRMEVHASVLAACGADGTRAADGALACELLPWLYGRWDEAASGGKLADAIAEIFGNYNELCKEFLNAKGEKTRR